MKTDQGGGKWWLAVIPAALLCLPCLLPVLAVAFLAAGGAGALGSFLSGTGGIAALVLATMLFAAAAVIYLTRNRWRRRGVRAPLSFYDAPPQRAGGDPKDRG